MLPDTSTSSVYVPRVSHNCILPLQDTLQDQKVDLAQASMKLLLFPLVLVHVRFCVLPLRVKSLFPPVLWSFCNQGTLAFTPNALMAPLPSAGLSGWGI